MGLLKKNNLKLPLKSYECISLSGEIPEHSQLLAAITSKYYIRHLNAEANPVPVSLIPRLHYLLDLMLSTAMLFTLCLFTCMQTQLCAHERQPLFVIIIPFMSSEIKQHCYK